MYFVRVSRRHGPPGIQSAECILRRASVAVLVRIDAVRKTPVADRSILRKATAQRLGQAPVDDEGLAVLAEHHVGRLEIAMKHAPAVGIGDRLADIHEVREQPPQAKVPALPGHAPACRPGETWRMADFRLSPRMNLIA